MLSIVPPITAFVAACWEHFVANMYFAPIRIVIRRLAGADFWRAVGHYPTDFPDLTWSQFLWGNLLPVTFGNLIEGLVLIGLVYWSIYLRSGTPGESLC